MEPKITVIVPVYNVEKYLPECLDSLACQTYKNLQVLVVNDGSTDSSPQVIEDYVRRFPDRFAQLNKPNGGLSDARNFAIGKAEGEWIAFLDGDDWADPEYYAKMADVMARGADVVVSDIEYFYENGQPSWIMPGLNPHAFDSPVKQAFLSPMFAWNKLYRADSSPRSIIAIRWVPGMRIFRSRYRSSHNPKRSEFSTRRGFITASGKVRSCPSPRASG